MQNGEFFVFDEEENCLLNPNIETKFETDKVLSGKEALAFIADMLSAATHGTYSGDTLFYRTERWFDNLEITVKKK